MTSWLFRKKSRKRRQINELDGNSIQRSGRGADCAGIVGGSKDTVGKNTAAIKEYIANQLKQDKEVDQLSVFDPNDPFKGSK